MFLGEHVHHLHLVTHIPALILGVGDHAGHGGVGDLVATVVPVAFLPKEVFNSLHGVAAGCVHLKKLPYHHRFFFIDDQPAFVLSVAKDAAAAQHHTVLDSLLMAEFHTAGELAKLVLGDGGHDGKTKLGVLVQGVDVVVLEEHGNTCAEKIAGVLDGVQGVTGKTGDLLSDDQIEFTCLCILYHPVEILALLGGDTGKTLVHIAGHILPGGIFMDQIFIKGDLVIEGI